MLKIDQLCSGIRTQGLSKTSPEHLDQFSHLNWTAFFRTLIKWHIAWETNIRQQKRHNLDPLFQIRLNW